MGRRRTLVVLGVLVLQALVVALVVLAGPGGEPHRAPVTIAAPAVVAQTLAERVDALPGEPFDAAATTSTSRARADVVEGRSVAAVVVDLSAETETLYVASARGDALEDAVRDGLSGISASLGRTLVVEDVVPPRGDAGLGTLMTLVGLAVLLGFVVAVVTTWWRGPVAATARLGAVRVVTASALAAVLGLGVAVAGVALVGGGLAGWWLAASLTVLAVVTTTYALEALAGAAGLGIALTLLVLAAAPVVVAGSPLLPAEPWATVTPWLPYGAGLAAATSAAWFDDAGALRPLLVLAAWTGLSVLTLVVARRERRRDEAEVSQPAAADGGIIGR
ncbi:hypothetical protein [Solicola sp. PLA-1-18]|uniref:hypothetical protein n=1 Tax=Solicola sp. PLA-1-18 TaxID=3380532 RepID=UPI003B8179B3